MIPRTAVSLGLLALLAAPPARAQGELSHSDSTLILRILTAEDRRQPADAALREGTTHANSRVRLIAQRALARIADPRFVARDSLPKR
jgi:hypothetical protein